MGRLSSVQTRVTGHHSQCRCRRQASEGYCSVPRAAPTPGTGQCHCLEVNHKMTLRVLTVNCGYGEFGGHLPTVAPRNAHCWRAVHPSPLQNRPAQDSSTGADRLKGGRGAGSGASGKASWGRSTPATEGGELRPGHRPVSRPQGSRGTEKQPAPEKASSGDRHKPGPGHPGVGQQEAAKENQSVVGGPTE